jgi:hypothetical protein
VNTGVNKAKYYPPALLFLKVIKMQIACV